MANISDTIRAALDAFVNDLSSLIQEAALESVEQALADLLHLRADHRAERPVEHQHGEDEKIEQDPEQ